MDFTSPSQQALSAQESPPVSSLSHGHLMLSSSRLPLIIPISGVLPLSTLPMSHPPYIQILHIFQGSHLSPL